MAETYVYDKAKYHYGGNYPEGLSDEQAFVQTGMFLGWIIDHNLYNLAFWADSISYVEAFKARAITGAKVYKYACDGVLTDEELNDEGNAFAHDYFDFEQGRYIYDYEELLTKGLPSIYHVQDSWENYEKIARQITLRYQEWTRKN